MLDLPDCGEQYSDFHKNTETGELPSYFEDVVEVLVEDAHVDLRLEPFAKEKYESFLII